MNITLTGIKYAAFASEETNCFEAKIRVDGELVGSVSNSGRGGCNDYHVPRETLAKLQAYAKSLPQIPASDGLPGLDMDWDLLIGQLLDDFIMERDLRTKMKRKVLVTHKDKKGVW